MSDVAIPQFSLPFRFQGGLVAAVVEQDTPEEITDCVQAIIRTPVGQRLELPGFGIPDQSFTQGGADPAPIVAAVEKWEPRADALAQANNESLSQFVTSIVLNVQGAA